MGPRGRAGVLAVILVLVLAGAYVAVAGGFRLPGPSGPGAGTADAGGVAGGDGTLVDVAGTGDVPEVGALAPDFTAVTLDGDEVTLSEFRGRPVWLTFGATWCASCRVEAPDIQAAYEESDDTVVLAVYLSEDADDVRPYVERLGMTFTHLPDPDADALLHRPRGRGEGAEVRGAEPPADGRGAGRDRGVAEAEGAALSASAPGAPARAGVASCRHHGRH